MLSEPSLSQYAPPMVLSCLVNQTEALGDNYAAMEPYMEKVDNTFDSICLVEILFVNFCVRCSVS